ncbi:MAG TPA: hypothetical protein VE954_40240 [Oligoflexus sp.]|uniref:hypothetical protein n=1 Tax=Oligoflexus sp. TaxID=1971216 RepID=UPI002D6B255C|nr:hypothetical protein [Oligoflexus sp.]HYX39371.1 hypothetical protein [Oligoflexus sp.]
MRSFAVAVRLSFLLIAAALPSFSSPAAHAEAAGISSAELMHQVRQTHSSEDIYDLLEQHQPRFWNELRRSDRWEVADTIDHQLSNEESADETSVRGLSLVERALRYVRINAAILDSESVPSIIAILNPQLISDLGYGRDTPKVELEGVAHDIVDGASSRGLPYRDLESFENTYRRTLPRYWSGK